MNVDDQKISININLNLDKRTHHQDPTYIMK